LEAITRCPELETGRNSVRPCTRPRMKAEIEGIDYFCRER